ncbi:cobyrinate a,c-diamide synthase [Spirulina major]|uniref:cobyrinate a,c-diamide synthase n=1 Tax=Spirulina major TaxID=270636 RepID=UPI00093407D4|nr:cobyrinate a,c-diamide synthase [Spirulina major]
MALIIAGDRSNSGKTTITLAILSYLRQQQKIVQSFKVGPDYIDPMFHAKITDRPCRNLDPILTSPAYVKTCFDRHAATADYAVIEGVMGLFDGVQLRSDWQGEGDASLLPNDYASTAHGARLLNVPIVLVIDCSRLSGSVAAIVHGYCSFDPTLKIAGLILNRVGSDRHLELLKTAIAPLNIPILGVLRRHAEITLPDRHLGLVPTDELPDLPRTFDRLAQLATESFRWDQLLPLLQCSPSSPSSAPPIALSSTPVKVAIARDRAFNFYYADNLELLEQFGATLIPWSPLVEPFPHDVDGLYLGGGFPELFAQSLSQNHTARHSLHKLIAAGLPTYAECGGLMYLCDALVDLKGQSWPMLGILPATTLMSSALTLGYRQGIAQVSSPLMPAGAIVRGHEFHHSKLASSQLPNLFHSTGLSPHATPQPEGWSLANVHASYLHMHWGTTPHLPQQFIQACARYQASRPVPEQIA